MEGNEVTQFGNLIQRKRKAKGWTFAKLEEVTEKHGNRLSASYINRLENGVRKDPSTNTLKVIIEALDLSLEDAFDSLGMGHLYHSAINELSFVIPDDLNKLNLVIQTEGGPITMSEAEKELIGKVISDLYQVTFIGEPSYFAEKAEGYVLKLGEILEKESYLIRINDQDVTLTFNVKVMLNKYKLAIQDIKSSLRNLNIKALYSSNFSGALPILDEYWSIKRDKDCIIIIDKVTEQLKPFIKP